MKKLLNSPLFVGAMALIAVGIVAMNVIRPMMGSGTSSSPAVEQIVNQEEPKKNDENKPDQPAEAGRSDEAADRGRIDWRRNPAVRDPFKPKESVSSRKSYSAPPTVVATSFHLSGIYVEPGVRFAVINNKIVSEGDRIGDYRVDEIRPDSVLLKGPKRNRLLKFQN